MSTTEEEEITSTTSVSYAGKRKRSNDRGKSVLSYRKDLLLDRVSRISDDGEEDSSREVLDRVESVSKKKKPLSWNDFIRLKGRDKTLTPSPSRRQSKKEELSTNENEKTTTTTTTTKNVFMKSKSRDARKKYTPTKRKYRRSNVFLKMLSNRDPKVSTNAKESSRVEVLFSPVQSPPTKKRRNRSPAPKLPLADMSDRDIDVVESVFEVANHHHHHNNNNNNNNKKEEKEIISPSPLRIIIIVIIIF